MSNPSVTIWNRIEARPRSLNIERALRSEIRDPLWMLSRQWQFGEFLAEDSGSLISTRVSYRTAALNQLSLGGSKAKPYNSLVPLETNVEKEPPALDLNLRMETGRQWFRLLKQNVAKDKIDPIIAAFKADKRLHFRPPRDQESLEKYDNAQQLSKEKFIQMIHAVANGRMIDGGFLYLYLKQSKTNFASDFLDQRDDVVDQLGKDYITWFEQLYGPLNLDNPSWKDPHLEYQFDCSVASTSSQPRVFTAKEYSGGHLDWYSFDYADPSSDFDSDLLSKDTKQAQIQTAYTELLPTSASYPGMPSARFWEIEDGTVNFGNIQAFSTDSAKMIFTQFGLLYSNDWLTFPLEMPIGSLAQINELLVSDVFGQRTIVPHVHQRTEDEFWGFFQLHDLSFDQSQQNDSWLLLAPVVNRSHQSKDLEKVVFIRDEMANMVWAIEKTIPDNLGDGIDGHEHAQHVKRLLQSIIPEDAIKDPIENEAELKYQLTSTVPDNWIPFIPVKREQDAQSRDTQLQRASMPRIVPSFTPHRIRPNTSIVKGSGFDQPYFIQEEEIPRSGAIVSLNWKRTRWHDGSIVFWLGRTKTNGRGEKSSGLRFDFVEGKG